MSLLLGLPLVIFAVLAQSSIMPSFSIFGAHPNLIIVLLVVWIAVGSRQGALFLIPVAGLVHGFFDSQALGVAILAFSPLILLTRLPDLRLTESDLIIGVFIAAVGTVAYEGSVLITFAVNGERLAWVSSMIDVLAPAVVANVLLLIPAYGLARLVSQGLQYRRAF